MAVIVNPEWSNAPYELQLLDKTQGAVPMGLPERFMEPYPEHVKDSKSLWAWVQKNRIPHFIEVEELSA